jgi:hypothetical protein
VVFVVCIVVCVIVVCNCGVWYRYCSGVLVIVVCNCGIVVWNCGVIVRCLELWVPGFIMFHGGLRAVYGALNGGYELG